ncbi:MAG: 50S ribosomal protein L30 [Thermoplasmata archaeon]|nr:50S ribosomal protein L30 [Thermoplasmata archaeon]NIS10910.1 50S ribosomal protein L30 [Thermoplasmata archaeon]NIT75866.1 50S ribosomal protein L30 [Thermoplasmata archaeon]NIY02237.1 50S ribosomal protein L30 [Thermoplasmata archaeon]
MGKCLLAIRIRGGVNAPATVEDTLKMLRMERNNAATLLDDRPEYLGMLQKAKDYITWGEPTLETVRLLLDKRGRALGDRPIEDEALEGIGYETIDGLAEALHGGEAAIHKLEGIKPFFRLHPPSKGFKRSVKRPYGSRGELGYRGEAINELAKRMC